MTGMAPENQGGLKGLSVLDLSQLLAGSFCAQLLGDHGADVIKIEPPGGDMARGIGPFSESDSTHSHGAMFWGCNRNKRSLVLDLKHPLAREAFLSLVGGADVLVENFRAGTMERLGLGYEVLRERNPRLVYTSVRGFGDPRGGASPYAEWPAVDIVAQAMGGIMSITGVGPHDPTKVGGGHADFVPGLFAAHATMVALWSARESGQGQYVDVSMVDCVLALCELITTGFSMDGRVPRPSGSRLPPVAPFGRVRCKDGFVVFGVTPGGSLWKSFCEALGKPELAQDPNFATPGARVRNQDALYDLIESFTLLHTKQELMARFGGKVPFAPVYDAADIVADPHFAVRDMLPTVALPDSDRQVSVAGVPAKLTATPGAVRHRAPILGEHTDEVLRSAGLDAAAIAALRAAGATR